MMVGFSKIMMTICCSGLFSAVAFAQGDSNLPIIQNVGVIPVQWGDEQRADNELYEVKKLVEEEFPRAVHASRKYRVTNDDLVANQWREVRLRQELVKSQELSGFFSLQVQMRSDIITFILRLMGPSLETYLLESSVINVADLKVATRGQVIGLIENLVFKMLNRIPVDAHVTSLQGRYLTLSGGQLAGIQIGDEIAIARAFIISRHPANGSWMNIKTRKLGSATVVEVKKYTSVAKLNDMIAEDAIRVGDGIKIPRIKPRAKFSGRIGKPRKPGRINDPVVVNPMYSGDTAVEPVLPDKAPTVVQSGSLPDEVAQPAMASEANAGNVVADTKTDIPGTHDLDGLVDMLVDYGRGAAGMRLWSYSGDASASAKLPMVLINHGRFMLGKKMTPDFSFEATAKANFGTTDRGSFFGFGGSGRVFTHNPMSKGRRWILGAEGQFNSLAVIDQTYGGADIVTGGGFVGVDGPFKLGEKMIKYYAEFALFPVNLGQLGVAGTKRSIQSSFNFRFTLAGEYELTPEELSAGALAWGGQLELENYSYSLEGDQKISGSSFNILATGAWKF